jgi:uncharacterized protein YkwD
MKRKRIAAYLLFALFASGFLSSGNFTAGSFLPACRSEELPAPAGSDYQESTRQWEEELLGFINQERVRQGLAPLVMDETLMRLARSHSRNMAQQGFISHDQPSGDLVTRMGRAGYLYAVARENVAAARTVSTAHEALLKSPPHKSNMLAGDVTHIGIGIVRYPTSCKEYMFITEVFAAPQDPYDPSMVQNALENRINELRRQGSGAISPDPLLGELASRSLSSLNSPYDRTELRDLLAKSAGELEKDGENELSRLEVQVQVVHNLKNLNIPAAAPSGQNRKYGTAVRQITDNRNQPAFLVLTLMGTAR